MTAQSLVSCLALAASALALTACGKHEAAPASSQIVARVNSEEISIHQVNLALEQQRGLKPEQVEAASRQVLQRLVDQEMAVQRAKELKLDLDARVVQNLDAARRDVLAKAYVERVAEGVTKPTAADVHEYYASKPALFSQRRIYELRDVLVDAKPDQLPEIEAHLKTVKTPQELAQYLKDQQLTGRVEHTTVRAESLPLPLLDRFAAMKPGQGIALPHPNGLRIVFVDATHDAPLSEEQSRAAIEQYLLNERKRMALESEVKAMRTAFKVEYMGKFAGMGANAATSVAASASAVAAPVAVVPAADVKPVAATSAGDNAGMDAGAVSKGLSGLK